MPGPYDITIMQASDNVGLSRITINENFLKLKAHIDSIATGISWTENIKDITDITHAIPTNGNRYISSTTSGGWIKDYIYEYQTGTGWIEIIPEEGLTTYVDEQYKFVVYTGNGWSTIGGVTPHNSLQGLNLGDYQHLTQTQLSNLTGGSSTTLHYHNDRVGIPASFPNATGRRGQWAIDDINKWMYWCIDTNLWVRWTIETNP